ncbi:MAG: hypothetical protein E7653_01055 [Ruminococcaceae bacterium]|nr:hypothetical protein [Oscillospiraceae bacterium]
MLDKKDFITEDFKIPPLHYHGNPFWAWNTEITPRKIEKQIKDFYDMGFGGFVIHSRNGLRTKYMGEEFMDMVKLAIRCAEQYGLKVWLYDEDRWPSGNAGGAVTVDKNYRVKYLKFTTALPTTYKDVNENYDGTPQLLASFHVELDKNGYLVDYKQTVKDAANLFVLVCITEDSPRYNGQANVDTLDPKSIGRFIELTYDKYYDEVGEYFGNTVEAIFTDEPHCIITEMPKYSELEMLTDVKLPWTHTFADTYYAQFGEDIVAHLPELIWEKADGSYSTVRYRYHEHVAARFRQAYSQQIGDWCREHGISFTGHFLQEQTLLTQTSCTKDVMRCYADEEILGIDILQGGYEFATAVQCRSVAHQCGKSRLMSELYGVNNWDTDFREYFHQGNWQSALGITVRIPHLSWMTMLGDGKRDYPATFSYQSPWYLDNKILEDHFSRLHTVLENGRPVVRVGVIHPIESFWLLYGVKDKTARICTERDNAFAKIFDWLTFGGIDFDFVNESLLPEQLGASGNIGEMRYDVIVVPDCITLRASTVDALKQLRDSGVRIVFAGNVPKLVDAQRNDTASALAETCEVVEFSQLALEKALKEYRTFELIHKDGKTVDDLIYQERVLDNERWLFFSRAKKIADSEDISSDNYILKLDGVYTPVLYDTMSGHTCPLACKYVDNKTYADLTLYKYDTALIRLEKVRTESTEFAHTDCIATDICIGNTVEYTREEANVCLLDMAEFSLDGVNWSDERYVLSIDTDCRKQFSLPFIMGKSAPQPWCVDDNVSYDVYLRFKVNSETELSTCIAFERAKEISVNGVNVPIVCDGWYVDEDIKKMSLPKFAKGENIIKVKVSISKTYGLEPMYLLGEFDVELQGTQKTLREPTNILSFGSVVTQGLPFYAGTLSYKTQIDVEEGRVEISVNYYRCEFVKVYLDGEFCENIILPPYKVVIPNVKKGKHILEIKCIGNRHNTFGSLHWGIYDPYYGPSHWYKSGDAFSREYRLANFGIMKCPRVINYHK